MKKHTLIFLVPVVTLIFCWTLLTDANEDSPGTLEYLELFSQTFDLVQARYLEPTDPGILAEGAVEGMLLETSPYAALIPLTGYSRLIPQQKPAQLGVILGYQDPMIRIIDVIPGSAAEQNGITSGDSIIRIGDKVTPFLTIDRANRLLSGDPGDKVEILTQNHVTMDVSELEIELSAVDNKQKISMDEIDGVRHIKFAGSLSKESLDQLKVDLMNQEPQPTILDLRHLNQGPEVLGVYLADAFIEDGKSILTICDNQESLISTIYSNDGYQLTNFPLVVLIDETSAGPGETCAAALKEIPRAVVIGNNSFGKAILVETVPLNENYSLQMVTGWYAFLDGKTFHHIGVEPDHLVEMPPSNDLDPFIQCALAQFISDNLIN